MSSSSRFLLSSSREISVDGKVLLSDVPANITLSNVSSVPRSLDNDSDPPPEYMLSSVHSNAKNGAFLGLSVKEPLDRILNSIGKLNNIKFLSIFRFKPWWSTMWIGSNGSDLQWETQLVVLQLPEINSYVLLLPLIEKSFRSALQPGVNGEVLLCVESGSTEVKRDSFSSCMYFHVSDNPYNLMNDAFAAVRVHLGTFRLLEEKIPPSLIDKFGWCTWDAFYLSVEPVGVWHGVKSFAENGLPLRFLIIDDGWQSINMDEKSSEDLQDSKIGSQILSRLYRFEENEKFSKYQNGAMLRPDAPEFDQEKHDEMIKKDANVINYLIEHEGAETGGLKALVSDLKKEFPALDDVYVWHALCGGWGGVRPGSTHLKSKVTPVKLVPGTEKTMLDFAVERIKQISVGLVEPNQVADLYDSMHSYLSDSGITGVKVDAISCLEYVCEEYGGRVELSKAYYDGLTKSIQKNFGGKETIASMEQLNDFFFLATKQISMARVSDDFWPKDPNGDPNGVYWLQGVHVIHCSYNSLWQGQFIQPDWDMFGSNHVCADFHAGSRAICGGPVYVSDKVGPHNFEILRKVVLPDGTILRCQHYALPTRDCLFENTLFDGKTLLKIWNLNKFGGVLGVFNCQGAGWYPEEHKIKGHPECYKTISGFISPADVEWDQKDFTAEYKNNEWFVIYHHKAGNFNLKNVSDKMNITLEPSSFEIITISPVYKLNEKAKFATVGLTNMYNSGGAVESLEYNLKEKSFVVDIKVKGSGKFLAYSSIKPKEVILNNESTEFEWTSDGRLEFEVPWTGGELSDAQIKIGN